MSGLATMDSKACGKMGIITITYYLWTTFLAVTTGIVLVICIHPGAAAQKEEYTVGKVVLSSADALLDLIRYLCPTHLLFFTFYVLYMLPTGLCPKFINSIRGQGLIQLLNSVSFCLLQKYVSFQPHRGFIPTGESLIQNHSQRVCTYLANGILPVAA